MATGGPDNGTQNMVTDNNVSRKAKPRRGFDSNPSLNAAAANESIPDALLDSAAFYMKSMDVKTFSNMGGLARTLNALKDRIVDGKPKRSIMPLPLSRKLLSTVLTKIPISSGEAFD